jgi:hypothetical protein
VDEDGAGSTVERRDAKVAHQLVPDSLHAVAERLVVDLVHPGVDDREREGLLSLVSEASVRAEFIGSCPPIRVSLKSADKFDRFVVWYSYVVACEVEQHIGHGD